jgi:hypothetical protein
MIISMFHLHELLLAIAQLQDNMQDNTSARQLQIEHARATDHWTAHCTLRACDRELEPAAYGSECGSEFELKSRIRS